MEESFNLVQLNQALHEVISQESFDMSNGIADEYSLSPSIEEEKFGINARIQSKANSNKDKNCDQIQ